MNRGDNVWMCRLVNGFGGLVSGFSPGIIATALDALAYDFDIHNPPAPAPVDSRDTFLQGVITSAILVGATVGSFVGGILADKLGRKKTVIISALISTIAAIGVIFTPYYGAVVAWRIILGLGVGVVGVVCPMYVSEMAPIDQRGLLNTLFQVFVCFGIFLAYLIGLGWKNLFDDHRRQWQSMLATGAIFSIILVIVGMVMEESKIWLSKTRGEAEQLINSVIGAETVTNRQGCCALFLPQNIRITLIGILLPVIQQFTGINTIIYYAVPTFQAAGLSSVEDAIYATVAVGFWNFLITLLAAVLVDKFGRRPLFLNGVAIMTVALFTLSINNFLRGPSVLNIVCIFVFIGGFEIGPGPLFNVIETEIFPTSLQENGVALANYLQWGFNLAISVSFPTVVAAIGQGPTYIIFAIVGLLGWLGVYFFMPETKDKAVTLVVQE